MSTMKEAKELPPVVSPQDAIKSLEQLRTLFESMKMKLTPVAISAAVAAFAPFLTFMPATPFLRAASEQVQRTINSETITQKLDLGIQLETALTAIVQDLPQNTADLKKMELAPDQLRNVIILAHGKLNLLVPELGKYKSGDKLVAAIGMLGDYCNELKKGNPLSPTQLSTLQGMLKDGVQKVTDGIMKDANAALSTLESMGFQKDAAKGRAELKNYRCSSETRLLAFESALGRFGLIATSPEVEKANSRERHENITRDSNRAQRAIYMQGQKTLPEKVAKDEYLKLEKTKGLKKTGLG